MLRFTQFSIAFSVITSVLPVDGYAQEDAIVLGGKPAQLELRPAGKRSLRVTIQPLGAPPDATYTPALVAPIEHVDPSLKLQQLSDPVNAAVGELNVEIRPHPLTVIVRDAGQRVIQRLVFEADDRFRFQLDDSPLLGLGEGGPLPRRNRDWRESVVEFDRRGRLHRMRPRWQADAYGSRNPVAMLVGTSGWAMFVATPWGQIDLSGRDEGFFTSVQRGDPQAMRQSQSDQQQNRGKGIPPMDTVVPGVFDVFVFDARDPKVFFGDVSELTGEAAMPPRWALGYMQSHRTLEDDAQLTEIVDTFRKKAIPLDAVIYLGTGFTPRGWNTPQPSFDFNPEIFKRKPGEVLSDLHDRDVKVVVHVVPWDRDRLPRLTGNIPARGNETIQAGHIAHYWKQHEPLVASGVDAWWPDEGDWFDLFERMKRHEMYFDGPQSTQPSLRPWSLHRNGHLGVARWGGWVWSGDTESTWKSLEAQIAVGINHSLSLSPFWGSDIGGFFPTRELDGELYARWFQFGAFCPSFRSHGRTWWTRLPWGWGLSERGPLESRSPPLPSAMNNPAIEPVVKSYAELRYRLLSYNYTLAAEARSQGLPMMRAMWVHYPSDPTAIALGDQYLWGRDLLIAPVYEKGAERRDVYLPSGNWYDWWTEEITEGGRTLQREVDLATMPIYVRAGTILPIDPLRQHTSQHVDEPITLKIFGGADGEFTLYHDDGQSMKYRDGVAGATHFTWDDQAKRLTAKTEQHTEFDTDLDVDFYVKLLPGGEQSTLSVRNGQGVVDF